MSETLQAALKPSNGETSLIVFVSNDFCCQSELILSKLHQSILVEEAATVPITVINLPLIEAIHDPTSSSNNSAYNTKWNLIDERELALEAFRHFEIDSVPSFFILNHHSFSVMIEPSSQCSVEFQNKLKVLADFKQSIPSSGDNTASSYMQAGRNAFDEGELVEVRALLFLNLTLLHLFSLHFNNNNNNNNNNCFSVSLSRHL
jgi:hypothetical protein